MRTRSAGAEVTVSSDVAGAEITIGDQRCVTPACTLTLRPGTYTLAARSDGYKHRSRSRLPSTPGQRELKLPLAFDPLPQILQVNTNFEAGAVYIDGQLAGQLQDGQFTKSGIAPGPHSLRVTGGDSEFRADWKSANGEAPQLSTPVSGTDVAAAVLANAGGAGALACNCDAQAITIDGAPAGQTSRNSVTPLKGLAEGSRRIGIEGRTVIADIRPNPTLSVFLATDRNAGTLVVETGQDNARIIVDNRPYPHLTEHGIARIQVTVGEHTLRVEREGFRSSGPATGRGREECRRSKCCFPSHLYRLFSSWWMPCPGRRSRLMGRGMGQVSSRGAFRTEVPPGLHRDRTQSKAITGPRNFLRNSRRGRWSARGQPILR